MKLYWRFKKEGKWTWEPVALKYSTGTGISTQQLEDYFVYTQLEEEE